MRACVCVCVGVCVYRQVRESGADVRIYTLRLSLARGERTTTTTTTVASTTRVNRCGINKVRVVREIYYIVYKIYEEKRVSSTLL